MALFWLCYRKSGQVSVAIIEARSLIHARMRTALDGLDAVAIFAEGHQLDADHAARVPRSRIGTMLSRDEAAALLDRIERGERRPAGKRKAPP
jgi:hypothetical protein